MSLSLDQLGDEINKERQRLETYEQEYTTLAQQP